LGRSGRAEGLLVLLRTRYLVPMMLAQILRIADAEAHSGGLDEKGCHHNRKTGEYHCHRSPGENPQDNAPVKKSRAGICHDKSSPNYYQLKYFEAFDSMRACLDSGGRIPG
jgi:hypothetical protein